VCSLNLNRTFSEQLEASGNREFVERRLSALAFEADTEKAGPLDDPGTHRQRMPPALRNIRKKRIGRHRIWYSGHHSNCFYTPCYLVENKQGDDRTEQDDNKDFQEHLKNALADGVVARTLHDPKNPVPEAEIPAWQKGDWYLKSQIYVAALPAAPDEQVFKPDEDPTAD
jgi:hypothetical protein